MERSLIYALDEFATDCLLWKTRSP